MNAPATLQLPRRSASAPPGPLEFEALRAAGMQALRELAGQRWTDHNLHDPGITLLEALSYALSEQGFRLDAPLAELLSDAQGRIDAEALGLHPAAAALSCHAGTSKDLRRWLLDRVEGLHDVDCATQPGHPGLWRLALEAKPKVDAEQLRRDVELAFAEQRQLGEDIARPLRVYEPTAVRLSAQVGVAGPRDPVEVLAEIFHRAQQHLAGLPGLPAQTAPGDGPQLRVPNRPLPRRRPARTRLHDLMAELRSIEGVAEVSHLELSVAEANGFVPLGAVALQLPTHAADLRRVSLSRRGAPLEPDPASTLLRLRDLQQQAQLIPPLPQPPRLQGRPPDTQPYFSLAGHLPAVYKATVDIPATTALRAYIALLEQPLAHAQAQLRLLPDFFACPPAQLDPLRPSYAWALLDNQQIPGIERLYGADEEHIVAEAFARHDDAVERRQRALDALLAMHGEVLPLNTLRQYLIHLDENHLQARLLAIKAEFARHLMALHRERGAGPDPLAPAGQARGLSQRLPLLLGLPTQVPRLGPLLTQAGVRAMNLGGDAQPLPDEALQRWLPPPAPAGIPADSRLPDPLPLPLLRAAAAPRRWIWNGEQVWLRSDDPSQGWAMGTPAQAALSHQALRLLHAASEAFVLVDHVLLRPRQTALDAAGIAWHCLSASLVLPDWSMPAMQPGFRAFVDETLLHNAPAHVRVRALWLDPPCWLRLDKAVQDWRASLAKDDAAIDTASARVRQLLKEAGA